DRNVTGVQTCALPILEIIAAIPAINPEPTKAGIIGTKILAISFNNDLNGDFFCFSLVSALTSAARSAACERLLVPSAFSPDLLRSEERRVGKECRSQR